MEKRVLNQLIKEIKIAPEQIVREYWEVLILDELSKQEWSSSIGFKGGTALRLVYGSPRFSDDLDFTVIKPFKSSQFFKWGEVLAQNYQIEITDSVNKFNTYLLEFRIKDDALPRKFKQKIEISKRTESKNTNGYELRLVSSKTTNLQPLLYVASLELIWSEKVNALIDRKEPRDLFDLWYIGQILNRSLPNKIPRIQSRVVKQTLNKLLPLKFQKISAELSKL